MATRTIEITEDVKGSLGNPWESSKPRRADVRYRWVIEFENYFVRYRRYDQRVNHSRIARKPGLGNAIGVKKGTVARTMVPAE